MFIVTSSFRKAPFSNVFPPNKNEKTADVFKFHQFEELLQKARCAVKTTLRFRISPEYCGRLSFLTHNSTDMEA